MFIRSHVALNLLTLFSLLVCGCVAPRPEDCVGQGPDWVVATYGKEKAAEINAIGYEKWIDESVGYNLTNGFFKLIVDIAPAVTNTTRIRVGEMVVVADRPGQYPFLCYKGDQYDLAFDPPSTNIDLLVTDDMAIPPCNAAKKQMEQMRKRLGDRDGDGLANEIDPHPDEADGNCFGSSIAWYNANCSKVLSASEGADGMPVLDWHSTSNSNAYYFVRFKIKDGVSRVDFTFSNNTTWLGNLHLIARAQDVCVVPLLIGPEYYVRSQRPFEFFECCEGTWREHVKITECGPVMRRVIFPVTISLERVKK